jgi:hypothetical protein
VFLLYYILVSEPKTTENGKHHILGDPGSRELCSENNLKMVNIFWVRVAQRTQFENGKPYPG